MGNYESCKRYKVYKTYKIYGNYRSYGKKEKAAEIRSLFLFYMVYPSYSAGTAVSGAG